MPFVDEAALTAHTEDALQLLIGCFPHACKEFGLTDILKKTNIPSQDVSSMPSISIGDCTLKVVENFSYLGSTISSNLSLDTALNQRIVKPAAALAHLGKRVWDNSLLAISTKMKLYHSRVLSTLLYGSEA